MFRVITSCCFNQPGFSRALISANGIICTHAHTHRRLLLTSCKIFLVSLMFFFLFCVGMVKTYLPSNKNSLCPTDEFETIEDTGSCVRGNGRGFSGLQTATRSGVSCQRWDSQEPQTHPMLPDIFRTDLKTANSERSCRNPGGIGDRPWCYTEDPNLRWEYCDIPKCGQHFTVAVEHYL